MALSTSVNALGYRRPWYWLAVIFAAALVGSILIAGDARVRMARNADDFAAGQMLRLQKMEAPLDEYFAGAIQLVYSGSEVVPEVNGDRARVRKLMLSLYRSRQERQGLKIYEVGVYYAPFQFSPNALLYDVSVHSYSSDPHDPRYAGPKVADETVLGDAMVVEDALTGLRKPGDDYRLERWYERAVHNQGDVAFSGPYTEDGRSFISTVKAFYRSDHGHGRTLVAVMSVDTLTLWFKTLMAAAVAPGEVAWIESSSGGGKWLLGTGRLPEGAGPRSDRDIALRYTGAFLHVNTDAAPLRDANAFVVTVAIALIAALWCVAGVLAASLVRGWHSRERTLALEVEQGRLENEIAIGRRVESELRKAAFTDSLTSLPNRAAFLERAQAAISANRDGAPFAVFFIDLDRFNLVNETLGHLAGDELLKTIGRRLRDALPETAQVSRLGGDEFVVLAEIAPANLLAFANRLLEVMREPMLLGGRAIYGSASIGIVAMDATYSEPGDLLRDADIAMYAAKRRGRQCCAVFDTEMRAQVASESELESALRSALDRREFVAYYQPVVAIGSREIVSFEALVRWLRPGRGVVGAADFIGYAETHGLVNRIDEQVLACVCKDARALFGRFPAATIAVNVSAAHLMAPDLAENVAVALREHGLATDQIRLELTETAVMANAEQGRASLDRLRELGLQIILDDFGVGHSSLTYLHHLPIAGVKIDRSFIAPLPDDLAAVAIVRSVVALAGTLGLYTVAEGVETAEQLETLAKLGVLYAQGFFFSPALELDALLELSAKKSAG